MRNAMFLRLLVVSSLIYVSAGLLKHEGLRGFEGKIVGGTPVNLDLFPHSVQIYNLGGMCAGSVLNSWTVLTAAHCFDVNKDLDSIYVIAGARFTFDLNAPMYLVKYIDIHEQYNVSGQFACDIALMFVDRPIKFSNVTQKAVIVNTDKWMHPNERKFTATGWGWTKYNGHISKLGLLMARLRFVSRKECSRMHNMTFTEDMFCLYGDGIRDTCKGDSGGAVLWNGRIDEFNTLDIGQINCEKDNLSRHIGTSPIFLVNPFYSRTLIVGITSHGDKCAKKNSPSIYSNVWYFRGWIKKHIYKFINNYCKEKEIKKDHDNP